MSKKECNHRECHTLIDAHGLEKYCSIHFKQTKTLKKETYAKLDLKKTPAMKLFYSSRKWTNASKRHREKEPFCVDCKEEGKTTQAVMVHHDPPYKTLMLLNLNPCSDKYLKSLCKFHHRKVRHDKLS